MCLCVSVVAANKNMPTSTQTYTNIHAHSHIYTCKKTSSAALLKDAAAARKASHFACLLLQRLSYCWHALLSRAKQPLLASLPAARVTITVATAPNFMPRAAATQSTFCGADITSTSCALLTTLPASTALLLPLGQPFYRPGNSYLCGFMCTLKHLYLYMYVRV